MPEVDEDEQEILDSIVRENLLEGEIELSDVDELLWRQVHPRYIDEKVVSGEAFQEIVGPEAFAGTSRAKYEVSTSMASCVSASQAFEHYTKNLESAGTYQVTVGSAVGCYARVIDDSQIQIGEDPVVGHAYIDLRGMKKPLQRRARSVLADYATKSGRVYPGS